MASRLPSRDQFLSPNRAKMPEVFVVQDYSVPVSPQPVPSSSPAYAGFQGGSFLSPGSVDSLYKRSNSTVSSIFDLSIESDQLERALKDNDANAVTKFLQVHHGKFPLTLHSSSGLDKFSNESRSRRPSSRTSQSQDADLLLRKNQTILERMDPERRESVTPECDIPDIFRTSIHFAILHNAVDVIKVLLRYGIDPNEPSINLINSERRPSVFMDSPYSHMELSKSRPEILPEESPESSNNGISPPKVTTLQVPETITVPLNANINKPSIQSQEPPTEKPRASFAISQDLDLFYTQDELLKLPPLFIAVTEKHPIAMNLLLQFGADANAQDRHGFSPLHLSASEEYHNVDCCSVLLRYGAKTTLESKSKKTPCDFRSNLPDLQRTAIQDLLAGKPSPGSDRCMETLKVGGKRISWSSNSDSNSRSFGRSGSIKKKFFKRSESKEKERAAARERRRNESTSTTDYYLELKDYGSNASSYRSSRSRLHSTAITEDMDSETLLVGPFIPCSSPISYPFSYPL